MVAGVERLRGQEDGGGILETLVSLTLWHGLSWSLISISPSSPEMYLSSHTIPDEPCLLNETADLCKAAIDFNSLLNVMHTNVLDLWAYI